MFDWLLSETNAIGLLKKDHDIVKGLFDEFEKAETRPAKKKIAEKALNELKVHAVLEEEIFYPAVRRHVGKDVMNEADEEHHVAKLLIAELESMKDTDDHHDAKFKVLSENVRHHIKEEENEVLPKAKGMSIDFDRLGQEMLARKKELLAKGVPPAAEEKLMANNPMADSPAKAARKKPSRTARASRNGSSGARKRTRTATKK